MLLTLQMFLCVLFYVINFIMTIVFICRAEWRGIKGTLFFDEFKNVRIVFYILFLLVCLPAVLLFLSLCLIHVIGNIIVDVCKRLYRHKITQRVIFKDIEE